MATFVTGQAVRTTTPTVEVTVTPQAPLRPGKHRFQLRVTDDAGNASEPATVEVIVRDESKPTAVIDAPASAPAGSSFTLNGSRSLDQPPGRIVAYEWTLLPA
jgi:hypothetical protein